LSKIPRKRKRQFGSLATTGSLLDHVRQGIVNSVAAGVLLGIAAALLPQFAAAIYVGYAVYKFGNKAVELKRDYDALEGEPAERMTVLAAREGFKAGVGLIGQEVVGKELDSAITNSVQTTARVLTDNRTFGKVTEAIGQQGQEGVLRYFFTTTMQRTLEGMYSGSQDAITDYVARRVFN
jgi:hypothetical protein